MRRNRMTTCLLCVVFALIAIVPSLAEPAGHLETQVESAIAKIKGRTLRTDKDTPWVIMHACIPFEQQHTVTTPEGDVLNAIGYLLDGAGDVGQETRLYQMQDGVPRIRTRGIAPGFRRSFILQDHVDQFLYCYADAGLPITAQGKASQPDGSDHVFTVQDLLDASLREFTPTQELGWTLVVTSHYLPLDTTWQTADGTTMSTDAILALAVKRDTNRETEGGPHHLFGVAYALDRYRAENPGKPLAGPWQDARDYLDKHVDLVKQYRNDDGSFSAAMFRRKALASDAKQMVWATGHTIEWMTVALDAPTLDEPWVQRGVLALARTINATDLSELSDGGMYHAAHALIRWRDKTAGER